MFNEEEIKDIEAEIADMRKNLAEKEEELKQRKYGKLRDALEARRELDARIAEELKRLGYSVYRRGWML